MKDSGAEPAQYWHCNYDGRDFGPDDVFSLPAGPEGS
jgi:hypothetical protein